MAALALKRGAAIIALDPAFLATAAYPVTVGIDLSLIDPATTPAKEASAQGTSLSALSEAGAFAWGTNKNRELGSATVPTCGPSSTACSPSPIAVVGLAGAPALAAGGYHNLSPQANGGIVAWGGNWEGQIGDGSTGWYQPALALPGLSGVRAAAGGEEHSLAVKIDGTVLAWGDNEFGQLGDGSTTRRPSPQPVPGMAGVAAVAAGSFHSLALKSDGTVLAWGANWQGQLGDGSWSQKNAPVQVKGPGGVGYLSGVVAIASRGLHSLALKGDGSVWAWGDNFHGKLGDGTTYNRNTPVQVKGPGGSGYLSGISALASGLHHSLALKEDGTAYAWGMNDKGQLGDGTTTDRAYPTSLASLGSVRTMAGGYYHSLAIRADGTVWGWGDNVYGQVGDGSTTQRTSPVPVGSLSGMALVSAGAYHSLTGPGEPVEASTAYSYDRLYRLTGVTRTTGTTAYSYDPAGNRSNRDGTAYSYDRADRIMGAGSVSYSVDANGNLVARGADSFGYDQANRLKTASVGGVASSYLYDGDGKRASKTVGGATTPYTYDVNASLPVLLDDGTRKYVWGLGLAYAVEADGDVLVYHSDGLGSIRAITDSSGSVVQTYEYDEYGVGAESQGGITQPFQYTGEQWDSETGLLYLRARMYEPGSGRFLQRDVFRGLTTAPSSLAPYSYTHNNPATWSDPNGKMPVALVLAATAFTPEVAAAITAGGTIITGVYVKRNDIASFLDSLVAVGHKLIDGRTGEVIAPPRSVYDYEARTGTPGNPFEPVPPEEPKEWWKRIIRALGDLADAADNWRSGTGLGGMMIGSEVFDMVSSDPASTVVLTLEIAPDNMKK